VKSKLFILLKSPHEFTGMDLMRSMAEGSDAGVILFEDAVLFAANEKMGKELSSVIKNVFVIRDDWEARGLPQAMSDFKVIDYPDAVDLIMERYDQTITV